MATRRNGAATIAASDEHPRQQIGIVAAARRVDLDRLETDGYRRRAKAEPWQQEGWLYYDLLGEIKQPTGYIANACSLARLYVATQPDPEQDPSAPLAGTPGLFEAEDAMDRLRQGAKGGVGGLTRNFTINAKVAGECFLVGLPEQVAIPPGGKDEAGKVLREGRSARQESWQIMSVSQVKSDGDSRGQTYTYRDNPQDQEGRPFPPGAVVIRMWQEHGEWPDLADCALRALLTECETLLILSRMVKATGRSRLAQGGGLLFLASEFDPTPALQPGADGEEPKRFIDRLMEAAETNIREEGTASAVVPIIATGPADLIEKAAKFVDVARALDPLALEQRKEIIQRIGQASDVPMEILVGLRNLNHWSSFQVDQSLWDRYGHPTMLLWAESLTVGYLRPMMEEAGVSPDVADRFMVWFDPAGAVVQPDRTTTVIESFDRFIISWETARTILGFSDSDAPSDEEIQQRVDIAIAMKSGPDGGSSGGDPSGGNAPNDGVPPASPQARSVLNALGADAAAVLTAAAAQRRQPVGRRLMQIDRTLRTRLVEAADAAMLHALERAGARVRNYAKRNSRVASAVEDISKLAAWQVPAAVGPVLVASLGLSDDELLANSFDDLQPRFFDRVAKAQGSALDAMADLNLDEGEIDAIRSAQQRDRDDAWAWLSGALISLGLSQLYSPAPDAPAKGEFDADSRVPTGLIREAMSRAGGAAGTATGDGRPVGGVALGQLVLDTFARHGQVVSGWQWVYGDPSSRTTPFDGHMELDGVEFATWDDDALLVQAGDEWLGVTHYRPGDHLWDQCDFVPLGLGSDEQVDDSEALVAGADDQPRGPDGKWLPTGGGDASAPKAAAAPVAGRNELANFLFNGINGPYMHQGEPHDERNAKAEVATVIAARMGSEHTEGLAQIAAGKSLEDMDTTHAFDSGGRWARSVDDNGNATGAWSYQGAPANPGEPGIRFGIEVAAGDNPDFQQSIREQGVSTLVSAWAGTSNDTNAQSLALQETAQHEFGLKDTAPWPIGAATQTEVGDKLDAHGPTYAAFVHAQYDETQARLKDAGIENLKLYRGMQGPTTGSPPGWFKTPEGATTSDIPLRPMSSFSSDRQVAESFGYGGHGLEGRVISTTVPADRVLSTPRSGSGALLEQEFVVLAGPSNYTIEKATHA